MSQVNSKADALDLDHQDQIDLQTSTVFEKKRFFITPSNLNCELIIYWFKAGGVAWGQGHANAKKAFTFHLQTWKQ